MILRADLQRRLMVWRSLSTPSWTPSLLSCWHACRHRPLQLQHSLRPLQRWHSMRPLRFSHHFDNVHDVLSLQTHKLRVLVLLLTSASMTTPTRLIPRMRCNKKRTINNHLHLDVHGHTIATVDPRHTLRYAMMNMCLN